MVGVSKIDINNLQTLIDNNDCYLVDVREPDEFKAAHIKGALNIPLGKISKSAISKFRNKKIVVYCQTGIRSAKASEKLLEYVKGGIFIFKGGTAEWKKAGKNIEKQGVGFSIMQQVQIVVGGMVLLGVILSEYHSELWIYFSGFFGAGLLFAGLSGWCGMAKLLAILPWNK